MGTWGSGNFDSDTAADHLSEITGRLTEEVEAAMAGDPVEIEPDEYWGVAVPCNLEILYLLAQQEHVGIVLPPAASVIEWKARFLDVWERTIDGLGPKEAYKDERRAVLTRTFDQLAELCAARES